MDGRQNFKCSLSSPSPILPPICLDTQSNWRRWRHLSLKSFGLGRLTVFHNFIFFCKGQRLGHTSFDILEALFWTKQISSIMGKFVTLFLVCYCGANCLEWVKIVLRLDLLFSRRALLLIACRRRCFLPEKMLLDDGFSRLRAVFQETF